MGIGQVGVGMLRDLRGRIAASDRDGPPPHMLQIAGAQVCVFPLQLHPTVGTRPPHPGREIAALPLVFAVADALPVRYRALVLLATFAGLRWGDLAGRRRENIDLEACEIRVVETTAELDCGHLVPGRRSLALVGASYLPG